MTDKIPSFDLPPTQIAKPLPPTTISKKNAKKTANKKASEAAKKAGQKRKRASDPDDAPRAFKRLMALAEGKIPRNNLDNGDDAAGGKGNKKKAKKPAAAATSDASGSTTKEELKIRPGESLAEFNRRVDAALPVSGLVAKTVVKNGKDPLGIKVWQTRKERKMQNIYAEWREIDRKIKERREEELEQAEEEEMEREAELGVSWKLELEGAGTGKKKKKKGKRTRYLGEAAEPEGDPWEEIKKRRGEGKVGLHDVAQAPPELKLPKKTLVGGATVEVENIPKSAGSLRQREELQSIRESVVAQYRKMMAERRPTVGT